MRKEQYFLCKLRGKTKLDLNRFFRIFTFACVVAGATWHRMAINPPSEIQSWDSPSTTIKAFSQRLVFHWKCASQWHIYSHVCRLMIWLRLRKSRTCHKQYNILHSISSCYISSCKHNFEFTIIIIKQYCVIVLWSKY